MELRTGPLIHGGIMANYKCTAACRHCLYACSPDRSPGYISASDSKRICRILRDGGCRSVHIGGGEPFLDFDGLLSLIRAIRGAGIALDYIETNGYWAGNESRALQKLRLLADEGVEALCISCDPFHAEYIPPERPIRLAELCTRAGMGYFLWKEQYRFLLSRLDPARRHTRRELEQLLSPTYIWDTARSYGLQYGGRALNIAEEYASTKPLEALLDPAPCKNLLSTGHFHVDYLGRFIPPGCTGIAIPLEEAVKGIPQGAYPALEALLCGGVAGLYSFAQSLGISPEEEAFPSKCALCFHLRRRLSRRGCRELDPEHYEASLAYY